MIGDAIGLRLASRSGRAAGLARGAAGEELGGLDTLARGALHLAPAAVAILAILLLLRSLHRPGVRRGFSRGTAAGPRALLLLWLAAGLALGLEGGRRERTSCLSALESGDAVVARGIAARDGAPVGTPGDRRTTSGPPPGRRIRLREAELSRGGTRCRLPRLPVRDRGEVGFEAGELLRAEGRWWRAPGGGGLLVARRVEREEREEDRAERASSGRLSPRQRARNATARRLGSRLPPDVGPAARALLLADRDDLSPELFRRFADAGLAHLLAISGLHVGLLGGAAIWLVGLVLRSPARHPVGAALAGLYVWGIGAPPSAARAALLLAGWALARARGSPIRVGELLGVAAVAAVLVDPTIPGDVGFQLSFTGFGGVLLGGAAGRRIAGALPAPGGRGAGSRRHLGKLLLALGAGAGAYLCTAPFAAHHFQRAAPIAVLSNLAGVPLLTLALAGLVGASLMPSVPGDLAADAAAGSLRALAALADFFAGLSWGHGAVAPPGPLEWAAGGLVVLALARFAGGAGPGRSALPLGLAAALWLVHPVAVHRAGGDRSLLCTLDVGQGDAAFLRTRRGHWILFDAGPRFGRRDAGLEKVVPALRRRGATGLDLLVLSHPDMDHLGGAEAVLREFRVRSVLDVGRPLPREAYAEFLAAVEAEGARWRPALPGARLRIDEATLLVLGPPVARKRRDPGPANDASAVVRVRIGAFVYLNSGDASSAVEEGLLSRWPADTLRAILMKVGHHGSRTSTSEAWLRAVRPRIAVISAGRGNRHGHPHPEVLDRLARGGVERVWRTDRDGTLCLEIRPDGAWRIRGEGEWRRPDRASRSGARPEEGGPPAGAAPSGRIGGRRRPRPGESRRSLPAHSSRGRIRGEIRRHAQPAHPRGGTQASRGHGDLLEHAPGPRARRQAHPPGGE